MLRFALELASFRKMGWLRFAKNVEVSVPVVEDVHFHCLLRTVYSLLTHLRESGFVRSNFRPQSDLNGASGTQREHSNKAMSLRCKVPRSLLHT